MRESARSESRAASDPVAGATDEDPASGLVAGDERCLEEAYRRWSPVIYSVALRALGSAAEAEDVTQQVFVGGWRSRSGFRPEYGSLPGWLLGIAKHRILDRQRARARELRLVGAVEQQAGVDGGSEPLEGLDRRAGPAARAPKASTTAWHDSADGVLGGPELPADR